MGEPTECIKLRARQFQRFYAHEPPLPNRDLITPDVLRKANFIQPNYRLSECVEGEEDFPPKWTGREGRASISGTLNSSGWKKAAWNHVLGMIDESDAIIARRGRDPRTPEVQNAPVVAPEETEMPNTTTPDSNSPSKTMKHLRSVLHTPEPDGMPGGWREDEEFPFTDKQVDRYRRWRKKQTKKYGKEESEEW